MLLFSRFCRRLCFSVHFLFYAVASLFCPAEIPENVLPFVGFAGIYKFDFPMSLPCRESNVLSFLAFAGI